MKINLKGCGPALTENTTPMYAVGGKILIMASFLNNSTNAIEIEDPETSQKVLGYFFSENDNEETMFLFSPSSTDITGEITAPVSSTVMIDPGKSIDITIEVNKYVVEKCFLPGKYRISIEYEEIMRSEELHINVRYVKKSTEKLLEVVQDEQINQWIREQALIFLKELNDGWDYSLYPVSDDEKAENKKAIDEYKVWWDKNKDDAKVEEKIGIINKKAELKQD